MVVVLVASAALAVPRSSSARTTEYRYVASTGTWVGGGLVRGTIELMGTLFVTPNGTSFTININDLGTPDGLDVWVSAFSAGERLFSGCMPVRSTRTIAGATANQEVRITIGYNVERGLLYGFPCTGFATAGIATVGGLT